MQWLSETQFEAKAERVKLILQICLTAVLMGFIILSMILINLFFCKRYMVSLLCIDYILLYLHTYRFTYFEDKIFPTACLRTMRAANLTFLHAKFSSKNFLNDIKIEAEQVFRNTSIYLEKYIFESNSEPLSCERWH
jgi:hypothetical protein